MFLSFLLHGQKRYGQRMLPEHPSLCSLQKQLRIHRILYGYAIDKFTEDENYNHCNVHLRSICSLHEPPDCIVYFFITFENFHIRSSRPGEMRQRQHSRRSLRIKPQCLSAAGIFLFKILIDRERFSFSQLLFFFARLDVHHCISAPPV